MAKCVVDSQFTKQILLEHVPAPEYNTKQHQFSTPIFNINSHTKRQLSKLSTINDTTRYYQTCIQNDRIDESARDLKHISYFCSFFTFSSVSSLVYMHTPFYILSALVVDVA